MHSLFSYWWCFFCCAGYFNRVLLQNWWDKVQLFQMHYKLVSLAWKDRSYHFYYLFYSFMSPIAWVPKDGTWVRYPLCHQPSWVLWNCGVSCDHTYVFTRFRVIFFETTCFVFFVLLFWVVTLHGSSWMDRWWSVLIFIRPIFLLTSFTTVATSDIFKLPSLYFYELSVQFSDHQFPSTTISFWQCVLSSFF